MAKSTYDLNNPEDARDYIEAWVDHTAIPFIAAEYPSLFIAGQDEDFLRVAKQLFLYCDNRAPLGRHDRPH